ncbi:MAG: HAD-IIB family hydrolase [Candidatus Rhabdochlamydia sp.]
MTEHRGWLALDIDGTLTDRAHTVPKEVVTYLKELHAKGWEVFIITGRTLSFASKALKLFDFPFYLAVQNGADVLYTPNQELVVRHYLSAPIVPFLEGLSSKFAEDFLIYAGWEKGDFCYYRPHLFSPKIQAHIEMMKQLSAEPWQAVESFSFADHLRFPLIKYLGNKEEMTLLYETLKDDERLSITLIRDPLAEGTYLNLITHPEATKGHALKNVIRQVGKAGTVIAAGDDLNDISMLRAADVKIVMHSAPLEMHALADIIAKPSHQYGIIEALQKALSELHP